MGASMLILLLPLAWLLLTGHARIARQSHRAGQQAIWQDRSWGPKILTGRLGAIFGATAFTVAAIILLAWEAATATRGELWVFPVGAVLASAIYLLTRRRLGRELRDPFHRRGAIALATCLGAVPVIAVKAWYVYNVDILPPNLLDANIQSLPRIAWETMPDSSDQLRIILVPLHFLDTLKLWLAIQYPENRWLSVLVSLDAALFGIVVSRSAALLADRIMPNAVDGSSVPIDLGRLHSRVFWGTIATLMAVTMSLQVIAARRAHDQPTNGETAAEGSTAKWEDILGTAAGKASKRAELQIDRLIDAAFEHVYLAIPAFTERHYSLAGEYVELAVAAAGQFEVDIESRLAAGLSERMENVAKEVDEIFLSEYRRSLQEGVEVAGDSLDLGHALGIVLTDATQRAAVTKPIAAGAGFAGAKLLGKALAKSIGVKIAAKVAAKGAIKGGSVLAGAGTGTAICAPAGPAALACTVIGATVTWIAADMVMIRLDEAMHRDEFEAQLRETIDEQKAGVALILRENLVQRAAELHRIAPQQARNVTLAGLSKDRQIETCDAAGQLIGNYKIIQDRIEARTTTTLAAFRADLGKASEDLVLKPMADEMLKELDEKAHSFRVSGLMLRGNFRADDRADRAVSGSVRIGGQIVDLERQSTTKERGFTFRTAPNQDIDFGDSPEIDVALKQHLRVRSDRFFGGTGRMNIDSHLIATDGLLGEMVLPLQVRQDKAADTLASTQASDGPSAPVEVTLSVEASRLAAPVSLRVCQNLIPGER